MQPEAPFTLLHLPSTLLDIITVIVAITVDLEDYTTELLLNRVGTQRYTWIR